MPITVSQNFESPHKIQPVDLNNDGLEDIMAIGAESLCWFENSGGGQYSKHTIIDSLQLLNSLTIYDWESDQDIDLFVNGISNNGNGLVFWLENDGYEAFTFHFISGSIISPFYIQVFDIDNDNNKDILVSSSSLYKLYWLINNGYSNFTTDTIGNNINQFQIADHNGDNNRDIVYAKPYN